MVRIPYIKIPSVRVGSIVPTSNIGTGGAAPAPPTPVTYLTQWKIVGNSEVHGNEIWSCGEYSAVDNKWHIRILPEGYGVVDIALDEPLRKINDVADSIEFVNGTATVTRNIGRVADISVYNYEIENINNSGFYRYMAYNQSLPNIKKPSTTNEVANALCPIYNTVSAIRNYYRDVGIAISTTGFIAAYDTNYNESTDKNAFLAHIQGVEIIYELETPTTETIQVPQIQEADSYSCVISQGGKAVEWSSFITNSE